MIAANWFNDWVDGCDAHFAVYLFGSIFTAFPILDVASLTVQRERMTIERENCFSAVALNVLGVAKFRLKVDKRIKCYREYNSSEEIKEGIEKTLNFIHLDLKLLHLPIKMKLSARHCAFLLQKILQLLFPHFFSVRIEKAFSVTYKKSHLE